MKILTNNDFLEVRLASMIADFDRDTLSNLYQAIIGYEALAVYMTLWSEANNEKISPICTHEQLFLRMRMPVSSFAEARRCLEAVGLLRTFISKGEDYKIYHYELYAPKSPHNFFDDTLLYGLLIKSIGEINANKLKSIYVVENKEDYGEEITAKFSEVFHPEFNDYAFLKATKNEMKIKGRNSGKIKSVFDYESFFNCLKENSQITSSCLKKEEMKEIERLATLNGVNEEESANIVNQVYDFNKAKGQRLDFDKLTMLMQEASDNKYLVSFKDVLRQPNINNGNTDLARKINLMEQKNPKDYLAYLQNGTKPASSDIRILNDLSKNYRLPNAVINAVVDYVLTKADNILSKPYCEKVAASLVRENCQTAVDAMNYIKKTDKKSRNKQNKTRINKIELSTKESTSNAVEENENWEMEWERLMDELNGGNEGGKA